MLVLDYAEDDDEKVGDTLPSINSKRRSKKNLSSKQELSLVVFVAGDTEPHRYDEISEALQTNSTINVLPNTNENKIYFLIDTVIDEKSI